MRSYRLFPLFVCSEITPKTSLMWALTLQAARNASRMRSTLPDRTMSVTCCPSACIKERPLPVHGGVLPSASKNSAMSRCPYVTCRALFVLTLSDHGIVQALIMVTSLTYRYVIMLAAVVAVSCFCDTLMTHT